ncbi:MAG: DUF2142 domain-containing protein [Actinomycetota bacterium]|nr:DUF2142 domain-containing protein [Actinomycetota bacterium]
MRARAYILVIAAFLLLGGAWLVTNPPGAAPDEPSHYLKALAAGRGELDLGARPPVPADAAALPQEIQWQLQTSRQVRIPNRLDPTNLPCPAFHPDVSAGCQLHRQAPPPAQVQRTTIVGTYQPFTYVLPGLMMRFGDNAASTMRLGRAGFWLGSIALLAVAARLVWSADEPGYSLVGLLVAVTPAVLFMGASLSANGLEIAAGLCFMAAMVRLTRDGGSTGWVWAAAAGSGAVLPLARVTGLLWVCLGVLLPVALLGLRPAAAVVRRSGRWAVGAAGVVAVGMASSLVWELLVQPHPVRSLGTAVRDVPSELRQLPEILDQAIGVFGWLDTRMSRPAYLVWKVLLVGIVVLAVAVSRARRRLVMLGLVVAGAAVTVGVAVLNRPTGFGAQGRYVLPFLVAVPLVAGELLLGGTARRAFRPNWLPPVVAVAAAAVHVDAWYTNARRYAVGLPGPLNFVGRAAWAPPLGWLLWMVVVAVAAAALVLAGFAGVRSTAEPAPAPVEVEVGARR